MIARFTEKEWSRRLDCVKNYILQSFPPVDDFCVSLGGSKTVRIRSWFPDARELVRKQLSWIVAEPAASPDATVWFWKEPSPQNFSERVLELSEAQDDDWDSFYYRRATSDCFPCGTIDKSGKWGIHLSSGSEYFYGLSDEIKPGFRLSHWQHVFFEAFFRIMNGPETSVVHGASVGVSGKGVLLCARGGMGKSTLTVFSLLRGFDYVADDYLILSSEAGRCLGLFRPRRPSSPHPGRRLSRNRPQCGCSGRVPLHAAGKGPDDRADRSFHHFADVQGRLQARPARFRFHPKDGRDVVRSRFLPDRPDTRPGRQRGLPAQFHRKRQPM